MEKFIYGCGRGKLKYIKNYGWEKLYKNSCGVGSDIYKTTVHWRENPWPEKIKTELRYNRAHFLMGRFDMAKKIKQNSLII